MNQKLIQDYIDNRLTAAERADFEQALTDSPALQREVEAMQSFKSAVRNAGLSESTPNLQPMLADIARPRSSNWLTRLTPALVAGIAIFGIVSAVNRVVGDRTNPTVVSAKALPAEGHLETKSKLVMHWDGDNPAQGADEIRKTFYREVPTIDLSELEGAVFKAAECGSCWLSFHYTYDGQDYAIYGRRESGNLDSGVKKSVDGRTLYTFSDAVGWYDSGEMTYVCLGGTSSGRIAIATAAMKTTAKLR